MLLPVHRPEHPNARTSPALPECVTFHNEDSGLATEAPPPGGDE
jgi:hypothetical protein